MSEYSYRVKRVKLGSMEMFEIVVDSDFVTGNSLKLAESLKELRKKLNAALDATYKEVL
jgi:hypothetical protein